MQLPYIAAYIQIAIMINGVPSPTLSFTTATLSDTSETNFILTNTPTLTATTTSSHTIIVSDISTPTQTVTLPVLNPEAVEQFVPTPNAAEIELTIEGELARGFETLTRTAAENATQTATFWTPTSTRTVFPTPHLQATVQARIEMTLTQASARASARATEQYIVDSPQIHSAGNSLLDEIVRISAGIPLIGGFLLRVYNNFSISGATYQLFCCCLLTVGSILGLITIGIKKSSTY